MPMTLKDFVSVLHLVQNGHHTVRNYYVFITTLDTSWELPIQCFNYCFGAEIGQKKKKKSNGGQVQILREIQIIKKPFQKSGQ